MTNGKYYWLKLKRDFFKRHDIRIVEDMPNGKEYILFYLKLLCESVDHNGTLRFSEEIPYNEDMLATITNTNVDIVRSAVKVFHSLQMMEILDDGSIFMREVQHMIGSAADNDNALRQARFKERKRQEINANVTDALPMRYQDVTKSNESKNKSKKQIQSIENKADVEPLPLNDGTEWEPTQAQFDEWKRLYPSVDVTAEFRNMRGWCNANPTRRKTARGITTFVNGWLSRTQNNPRTTQAVKKAQTVPAYMENAVETSETASQDDLNEIKEMLKKI